MRLPNLRPKTATQTKATESNNADLMKMALLNHRLVYIYHGLSSFNENGDIMIDRINADAFDAIMCELDNLLKTMEI